MKALTAKAYLSRVKAQVQFRKSDYGSMSARIFFEARINDFMDHFNISSLDLDFFANRPDSDYQRERAASPSRLKIPGWTSWLCIGGFRAEFALDRESPMEKLIPQVRNLIRDTIQKHNILFKYPHCELSQVLDALEILGCAFEVQEFAEFRRANAVREESQEVTT